MFTLRLSRPIGSHRSITRRTHVNDPRCREPCCPRQNNAALVLDCTTAGYGGVGWLFSFNSYLFQLNHGTSHIIFKLGSQFGKGLSLIVLSVVQGAFNSTAPKRTGAI